MMDMGIREKERVLLRGNYLQNKAGVKGEKRELTRMLFLTFLIHQFSYIQCTINPHELLVTNYLP